MQTKKMPSYRDAQNDILKIIMLALAFIFLMYVINGVFSSLFDVFMSVFGNGADKADLDAKLQAARLQGRDEVLLCNRIMFQFNHDCICTQETDKFSCVTRGTESTPGYCARTASEVQPCYADFLASFHQFDKSVVPVAGMAKMGVFKVFNMGHVVLPNMPALNVQQLVHRGFDRLGFNRLGFNRLLQ